MTRASSTRVLAFVLIAAACGYTIMRSMTLVRYGIAELTADAQTADAVLGPFLDEPMVGHLARTRLAQLDASGDPSRRIENMRALLAMQPTSALAWLEFARGLFADGAPKEKIVGALTMSYLTGPNESHTMANRAAFALPLWPALPVQMRKSVVSDLIGGWIVMSEAQRQATRASAHLAKPETKEELRSALSEAGKNGLSFVAILGLARSRAH